MILWLWACTSPPPEAPVVAPEPVVVDSPVKPGPFGLMPGSWSAWFTTDGGPVRFELELLPGESCRALIAVGGRPAPEPRVSCDAGVLSARFAPYGSTLTATIGSDGRTLRGHWAAPRASGDAGLPFEATLAPAAREPLLELPTPDGVSLLLADGRSVHLNLQSDGVNVRGALAHRDGDWGPLAGGWTAEGLELSGFDGEMPSLLRLTPDPGGRLAGHLWRGSAAPIELVEQDAPADLNGWARLDVGTVDLAGLTLPMVATEQVGTVPASGPRVVHVISPSCRGCGDSAPVLARVQQEVPGVTVVLLGWAPGLEPTRSERDLSAFRTAHQVTTPIWRMDAPPAFLPADVPLPATLFLRADGSVAASHVGFHGPATGALHEALGEGFVTQAKGLVAP